MVFFRYRALYNYKPSKEDELSLSRGAFYHVSDRCKDGWYRGKCLRTGNSGVFPGNYVQLVPPDQSRYNHCSMLSAVKFLNKCTNVQCVVE